MFLATFILMSFAFIYLLVQIRVKNQGTKSSENAFKEEQDRVLVSYVIFGLSYLLRFIVDIFVAPEFTLKFTGHKKDFSTFVLYDTLFFCDGICFLQLLLLHRKTFLYNPIHLENQRFETYGELYPEGTEGNQLQGTIILERCESEDIPTDTSYPTTTRHDQTTRDHESQRQ